MSTFVGPVITSPNDSIIMMVRSVNILLAQKPATEIMAVLNDHVFPRIRMRILSATKTFVNGKGTGKNQGSPIWFDDLTDMADPAIYNPILADVNTFMTTNPVVRDGVWAIAAKLAAALMTSGLAAQVKPQAEYATDLEKSAMEDLEKLIRMPLFQASAEAYKETKAKTASLPRLYIAMDVNDDISTYTSNTNTGKAFGVTQQPGKIFFYVGHKGVDVIEVSVPAGRTLSQILHDIMMEWRNKEQGLNGTMNVTVAPSEGVTSGGTRSVDYLNYPAMTSAGIQSPIVNTTIGFIEFAGLLYDKTIDYMNVEMVLMHETVPGDGVFNQPGIKGLLYGSANYYSGLTQKGPHSITIDLKTGLATNTTTSTNKEDKTLSDTFYFGISNLGEPGTARVTVSGSVGTNKTYTVTIGANDYSYTTQAGDTQATMLANLAAVITAQAAPDFTAVVNGTTLEVRTATNTSAFNNTPFAVSTSVGAASFITGDTLISGGRLPNTIETTGPVVFRSQEMVDDLNPVPSTVPRQWTITAERGETVLQVVSKIQGEMARWSATSRILGAVRAPTYFKVQGTEYNAPGLTIVPYTKDNTHYRVVFDILEVPKGLMFAAMPASLIPGVVVNQPGIFDDVAPKSLNVDAKTLTGSGASGSSSKYPTVTTTNQGRVNVVQATVSPGLMKVMTDVRRMMGYGL